MFQSHSPQPRRPTEAWCPWEPPRPSPLPRITLLIGQERIYLDTPHNPGLGRRAQQCPQGQKEDRGEKVPCAPAVGVSLGFSKITDTSWLSVSRNQGPGGCLLPRLLLLPQDTVPHTVAPRTAQEDLPTSTPGHTAPPISEPLTQACSERSPSPPEHTPSPSQAPTTHSGPTQTQCPHTMQVLQSCSGGEATTDLGPSPTPRRKLGPSPPGGHGRLSLLLSCSPRPSQGASAK